MLTCREVAAAATDYMENAGSASRRAGVWLHLRLCPNCREYLRQLGRSIGLVKRAAEAPPEPAQEEALVALFARKGCD